LKPYGIERYDRVKCSIKGCGCGDMSSKHPRERVNGYNKNKRLKKHARQVGKRVVEEE
jgi:hypothetical protein